LSIDNAETNNLDADTLHHSTAITVRTVPNRPLKRQKQELHLFIYVNEQADEKQYDVLDCQYYVYTMPKTKTAEHNKTKTRF